MKQKISSNPFGKKTNICILRNKRESLISIACWINWWKIVWSIFLTDNVFVDQSRVFFVVETLKSFWEKMNKIWSSAILCSLFLSSCSSQSSSICSTCKCDNQTIRSQTKIVANIHDHTRLAVNFINFIHARFSCECRTRNVHVTRKIAAKTMFVRKICM